ncbi:hypothetical protein F5Y06DRAFT_93397 [Hypoxylon sp. FL0890]|nr:hypothetical protein F5Y06DRAFT_93397 [Hypoxylon sp. FL0890]
MLILTYAATRGSGITPIDKGARTSGDYVLCYQKQNIIIQNSLSISLSSPSSLIIETLFTRSKLSACREDMRAAFTISAVAVAAAQVHAQDLNQTIVGCVEVECPASSQDTVNDNCTIADTGSFPYIGLTRVAAPSQQTNDTALSGLSWVKGFNITDSSGGRNFHSSFYLGAPPSLSLNASTGGCAVFMHGVSSSLAFGQNQTDPEAQGTCADAMGASCVSALTAAARSHISDYYNTNGDKPSAADACARLQSDLQNATVDACAPIQKGSWSNFTSVALTGDGAPQPISQQQNASSNCWPITPKDDSLALVSEYTQPGSDLVEDAEKAQWAITPILTVYYPISDGSPLHDVDASLSCVKVMGPARASLDTMNNGTNDNTGSGAAALSSSYPLVSATFCAVIAAVFASYMA